MAQKMLNTVEKKGLKRVKDVSDEEVSTKDYLQNWYYDLSKPGSFSGVDKFWRSIKQSKDYPSSLTRKKVKSWLEKEDVYKIHKPPERTFETEKIIVGQVDEQWDGDLVVFTQFSKYNKGHGYIAVFIDLFSRFVWLEPLKTKSKKNVLDMMKSLFSEGRKPSVLRTDQGVEWKNDLVRDFLKKEDVKHFIAYSAYHASYAERCIRSVKSKLFKYFTKNTTYDWLSVIDDIADSMNATVHSFTKMAPKDVTVDNERAIYERIYLPIELKREKTPVKFLFRVGDKVRLSNATQRFDKGYQQRFTQEIFVIAVRLPTHPVRYRVKDLNGEMVLGSFYEPEMIIAHVNDETLYAVEKVIRYKTVNKKKMALVKWAHYSDKFNSYVPVEDLKKYK